MKKLAALAVIAPLFALANPGTAAADKVKLRINSHHNDSHRNDSWKISCNTARHMVRERGYNPVKIKSCISTVYSFYAVRNGRTYVFYVDSRTRSLWRG
ncbi:MAG: hypothetical protein AB7F74_07760 [Parvibaculaceae bacterium]